MQQHEERARMTEKQIRQLAIDMCIDIDIDMFIRKRISSQQCVTSFSSQKCVERNGLDKKTMIFSHERKTTLLI